MPMQSLYAHIAPDIGLWPREEYLDRGQGLADLLTGASMVPTPRPTVFVAYCVVERRRSVGYRAASSFISF